MKKFFSLLVTISIFFTALCSCQKNSSSEATLTSDGVSGEVVEYDFSDDDVFTDRDYITDFDANTSVFIELYGNSAKATSSCVKITDTNVKLTGDKTYVVSGTLTNGCLIIDCEKNAKPHIIFDNVTITNNSFAAVYILNAEKVFITLKEGSVNILSSLGEFNQIDENNVDSTVFSKHDLTFNGSGSLEVISETSHGIVSKDDLVFIDGKYKITSASHAIDANDSVRIDNSELVIDAGKDGIHSENTDDAEKGYIYISDGDFKISSEGDGISAGYYLNIIDGDFDITAGGGSENGEKQSSDSFGGFMGGRGPNSYQQVEEATATTESGTSMKGLKSGNSTEICNGIFNIDSADDCIHSNSSLNIKSGSYNLYSGDDAIHAEATLKIDSVNINIFESYEGIEALDIVINNGNIILSATDDGLNAAGGNDSSGFRGGRDGMFNNTDSFGGGKPSQNGDMNKGMMSQNSDGSIVINGGTIKITAYGDGIDANGSVEINGGNITVIGPNHGDTSTLDYDTECVINGGLFLGTGASGMAQSFSDSSQGVIAVNVGAQSTGSKIVLKSTSGNELLSSTAELDFSVVIISSENLVKNENYILEINTQAYDVTAA